MGSAASTADDHAGVTDDDMIQAVTNKRAEDWTPPPAGDVSEGQRPYAAYIPCPLLSSVYNSRKILADVPDDEITLDTLVTYADLWLCNKQGGGDDAFATALADGVWKKMAGQDHLLVPSPGGPDVDGSGNNSHQLKLFRLLEMPPIMHGTASGIRYDWRTLTLGFNAQRFDDFVTRYDKSGDKVLDLSELALFLEDMPQGLDPNFHKWDKRLQARGVFAALCLAFGANSDNIEVGIMESLFKGIYVPFQRVFSLADVAKKMGHTVWDGLKNVSGVFGCK